jgi:hypothetical protein
MAAGLGFKTFTTGEVLTAADVNGYLMQGILVFASEAARNSAITSPQEGQFAFTKDNNSLWYYTGSAWVASGATGDIEGVTAGVGISGGGTSGTVTITNDMATTITASGDIVVGTGSGTYDNLPIGTTGQVLTADTTVSPYKVKWASPAGGGKVLQVVYASSSTNTSVASTTYTDTGLSGSITPSSTSSTVLVAISQQTALSRSANTGQGGNIQLVRGSTVVFTGADTDQLFIRSGTGNPADIRLHWLWSLMYLDSPSTTSSTTYKTQGKVLYTQDSGSIVFQNSSNISTMILMEIGA